MNKKIAIILISISMAMIIALISIPFLTNQPNSFEKEVEKATIKWLKDNDIEVKENNFEITLFQLTGQKYLKMIEEKKDGKFLSLNSVIKINKKKEISFEKKYTTQTIFQETKNLTYNYKGKYNEIIQVNDKFEFEDLKIKVGDGKYNPEIIIKSADDYERIIMTLVEREYLITYYVHIKDEKFSFKRTISIKDLESPTIKIP